MDLTFQRRTDLALAAVRTLYQKPGPAPGADVAVEIGTTTSFLPHVMGPLVGAELVTSMRGPGGGYRLTQAGLDASVLDVVQLFEGTAAGQCVLNDGPCPGTPPCVVHALWADARQALVVGLGSIPAVTPKGSVQ